MRVKLKNLKKALKEEVNEAYASAEDIEPFLPGKAPGSAPQADFEDQMMNSGSEQERVIHHSVQLMKAFVSILRQVAESGDPAAASEMADQIEQTEIPAMKAKLNDYT